MKIRKIISVIILIIAIGAILSACSLFGGETGNNSADKTDKVTIMVNIYVNGDYTASDFVDLSGRLKIPTKEPVKTGYEFVGWYLDEEGENPVVPGEKAASVVNIYPIYKTAQFDVKIIDKHNGNDIIKVNYGEKIEISAPKSDGYIFKGWYQDEECTKVYNLDTPVTAETEIYVGWDYADYTIKYELNGGKFEGVTPETTYRITDMITLAKPVKDDYEFVGWYTEPDFSGEKVSELDGDSGNKTFYAKYACLLAEMRERKGMSIKEGDYFVIYTDSSAQTINIPRYFVFSDGSSVKIRNSDGQTIGNNAEINANIGTSGIKEYSYELTVTAEAGNKSETYVIIIRQYDESNVTVTYKVNGESVNVENISRGDMIETPYVYEEEKTGYTFGYWAEENTEKEFDFNSVINGNITLEAVFLPVKYSIAYYTGAAENPASNPTYYTIESTETLADAVVPGGYEFCGWYFDEEYTQSFNGFTGLTGNKTLYALYTKDSYWSFEPFDTENYIDEDTQETLTRDVYNVTKNEYPRFLDFLMFNRISSATAVVYGLDEDEEESFYITAAGEISVSCSISVKYSETENKVTVTFGDYKDEPTETSIDGTYEQIDFIGFAKEGNRESGFNDFAIEHVKAVMTVSNTEQLVFALENGYKPDVKDGTTAQAVYSEMKNILRNIIGNGFSEKDKVIAIAEYLVKTVAYDNETYEIFNNPEMADELYSYRCFYLEGAIIDKIAVCDGISKAFTALCAIEGIKSVCVDGTMNGVNHAWNKVYIDVNGDGLREWMVVDCTAANTLSKTKDGTGIEVINHTFILTTDDMLVNKSGYVYNEKWEGKYVAQTVYDIYGDVLIDDGGTDDYYAENAEELTAIFEKYVELKEIYGDNELMLDFCAPKYLILENSGEGGQDILADGIVNAMTGVGFTVDDINNNMKILIFEGRDDDNYVFAFFVENNNGQE